MAQDKSTIRKQILIKRSALSLAVLQEAEQTAVNKLVSMKQYRDSSTVMAYMDFRNEVPTEKIIHRILSDGKRLVLPLTDSEFNIIPHEINPDGKSIDEFFAISSLGISEPDPDLCPVIDPTLIDLVIVPGSVFDLSGNRLGYGKGCYDRFLPLLREGAYKFALAYKFQILEQIPTDSTDIKMDQIITV